MKIRRSLRDQGVVILNQPEDYLLSLEPDRANLSFIVCGSLIKESATTIFYDGSKPQPAPDLILPPELAAVTLDRLRSLQEEGTRLDELAAELRHLYLDAQKERVAALKIERLKFELDAVEKTGAETLLRANPLDGSPIVFVEIPIKVARPSRPGELAPTEKTEHNFRLRITFFVNSSRDSLSRVERQLLPQKASGTVFPRLPAFSRPLPAFSVNSMLLDYVPDVVDFLEYELFPPADLLLRRKKLLKQLESDFENQLLEVNEAALVVTILVEVIPPAAPSASVRTNSGASPNLGAPQPAAPTAAAATPPPVMAICRVDVSNAGRDVSPVVTLSSPHLTAKGKPNVPLTREITGLLRWDWRIPVEDEVDSFREQLIRIVPGAFTGL